MASLDNRALGEKYRISVGSSVPIESILGSSGFLSFTPLYKKHNIDALWINVSTLVRNIINAYAGDKKALLDYNPPINGKVRFRFTPTNKHRKLANALIDEMDIIQEAIGDKLRVVFYCSRYEQFALYYPHAKLRYGVDSKPTELQLATAQTILTASELAAIDDKRITEYKNKITTREEGIACMLSHYRYDLLSQDNFRGLFLIESYTGKLRSRTEFGEKLADGNLTNMPFNDATIQIFGDGEWFKSQDNKTKQAVLLVAKERRWDSMTTKEKMRTDLKRYREARELDLDRFFTTKL